jgi:hypothetical protein
VYDMYPWNETDSGASHDQDQNAAAWLPAPRNGSRHANAGGVPADFTKAVQLALDRRDNGGDAVPASPPATPPTASLTRQ